MVKTPPSDLDWKPKVTRPDRNWSSRTLIQETERYVRARDARQSAPLLPAPSSRPAKARKAQKAVQAPLQLRLPVPGRPVERRRKSRPGLAAALFLGGFAVLFLDVLSIRDGLDAVFFLSLFLGVILIVQGLRVFTQIRWTRRGD